MFLTPAALARLCFIARFARSPGCKLDIFERVAVLECATANSFEVFVKDDAFEGGAVAECQLFDDFELIRESDAFEGEAISECALADFFEIVVER